MPSDRRPESGRIDGAPISSPQSRVGTPWIRFFAGLTLLSVTVAFFMSGVTPPGACGEVLRHNQSAQIDASPLFYSEVEHMAALEDGVKEQRRIARSRRQGEGNP